MIFENDFNVSFINEEKKLPLVLTPKKESLDLIEFLKENSSEINRNLREFGAILFRGFGIDNGERLNEAIQAFSGNPLEYKEQSSPRHRITGNIYTSTDYPAAKQILLHNENSYQQNFPAKIFFCCEIPAEVDGETPIADCRKVLSQISQETIEKAQKLGWMLIRNYNIGFGLKWETVFQTENREEVEQYCLENNIEFEWKPDGKLTTKTRRKAIHYHPVSGEETWFNHAMFFHITSLDAGLRNALLEVFDEKSMPSNTFWGDESVFSSAEIEEIRNAYQKATVSYRWEKGDFLMVENLLVAHGRNSFKGERKILVGMSEPISSELSSYARA